MRTIDERRRARARTIGGPLRVAQRSLRAARRAKERGARDQLDAGPHAADDTQPRERAA